MARLVVARHMQSPHQPCNTRDLGLGSGPNRYGRREHAPRRVQPAFPVPLGSVRSDAALRCRFTIITWSPRNLLAGLIGAAPEGTHQR
jgi:hypothetical protein